MNKKQEFSAKVCFWCAIGFILCIIFALLTGCEKTEAQKIPAPAHYTLDDRLDAIEWVESRGDANAVGSCGGVGAYQLTEIYVDDVNRILGLWDLEMRFSYDDRWDRDKSRMMTKIFTDYWVCHHIVSLIRVGVSSNEAAVRIHNGGPNGWQKECTKAYWEKVKARLEYEGD